MNAIRLGVAPADKVQGILTYFKERWQPHGSEITQPSPSMTDPFGHTIEPLNNTWEMMARIRSNDAAGALELLRRLWGLQVDPNSGYYTGTFWESSSATACRVVGSTAPPTPGEPARRKSSRKPSWARLPTTRDTRSGR